jgi:hypothetical protein
MIEAPTERDARAVREKFRAELAAKTMRPSTSSTATGSR